MLILSRDLNQQVILTLPDGREIRVMVRRCGGLGRDGRYRPVRLGIQAPPDVTVFREELRQPRAVRRKTA